MGTQKPSKIPLPKVWKRQVRSAMLHVISLAQYATVYTRSWAVDSMNGRVRLKAENDRLIEEVARLREEMRIKDARTASIVPQRRPHYSPVERLAILELRAARGWSNQQAARLFWSRQLPSLLGCNALMKKVPTPWCNSASPSTSFRISCAMLSSG